MFTVRSTAGPLAFLTGVVAVVLAVPGTASAGPAAFSTDPVARDGFGPVEVAPSNSAQTVVSTVRVGHHPGFDRLVFTFAGPLPGYSVAYVPQVTRDGSGLPLTLPGSSYVLVTLRPTSTTTHSPQQPITPHFPMLRQVAGAGDFEAVASYGVGLTSRSGMRVSTLTGPNRLVVDFAIPAGTAATPTPVTTPVAPAGSTQSVGSQPPQETGAATPADTGPTSTPSTNPDRPAAAHPGSGDDANDGPSTGVLTAGGVGLVALGAGGYLLFRRRPI